LIGKVGCVGMGIKTKFKIDDEVRKLNSDGTSNYNNVCGKIIGIELSKVVSYFVKFFKNDSVYFFEWCLENDLEFMEYDRKDCTKQDIENDSQVINTNQYVGQPIIEGFLKEIQDLYDEEKQDK
jgi:hypothetical protein